MAARSEVEAIFRLRDEMSAQLKVISGQLGNVEKNTKKTGVTLGELHLKYVAAAAAVAAFVASAKKALEAQAAQEQAINALNLSLSNQGNLLPGTSERLQDYASALQRTTTYGDEVILQGQALLASFGMNEEQLKSSTRVALDFASATGRDLTAAINLLGKAFVGETGELSRYGIIIDKNIPKSEKFDAVMAQMATRFGGSAQAAAATYTGQMAQLGNAIGDAWEALGKLTGQVFSFGEGTAGATAFVQKITEFIGKDMVIALGEARALWSELASGALSAVSAILSGFKKFTVTGWIFGDTIQSAVDELDSLAAGFDAAAEGFREESNEAALAAGNTLKFTNQTKDATDAVEKSTKAVEKLAINQQWWNRVVLSSGAATNSLVPILESVTGQYNELLYVVPGVRVEVEDAGKSTEGAGRQMSEAMISVGTAMGETTGDIGRAVAAVINLQEAMSAGTAAMGSYVGAAIGVGSAILNAFRGSHGSLTDFWEEFHSIIGDSQRLFEEFGITTEEWERFVSEAVSSAASSLGDYFSYIAGQEELTAEQAEAAAGVMSVAFQQAMAATGNLVDAFAMLGPSFSDFLERIQGFVETPAVDVLRHLYSFVEQNAAPLAAIADLTAAMSALGEVGLLTAEDLASIGTAVESEFQRLVDSGADMSTIIASIGPQLAALYEQYQLLGQDVPPWLQAISGDLEGIEPPRTMEDIFRSIEEAIWAIAEAFGVARTNAQNFIDTASSATAPPPGGYTSAQGGMFERLRKPTMILAHPGELVNIIPAAEAAQMAVRTAQSGIPGKIPAGSLPPEYVPLPPEITHPPKIPEMGGAPPPGSAASTASFAAQVAAAMPPSVAISAPANINVNLPELSARRWLNTIDDDVIPAIKNAIRNNRHGLMSAIREQL